MKYYVPRWRWPSRVRWRSPARSSRAATTRRKAPTPTPPSRSTSWVCSPARSPRRRRPLRRRSTDFQTENPNITVKTQDYEWKATTFAAQLAGGTLPTVFKIPFTDAKTLIANGQLADIIDG